MVSGSEKGSSGGPMTTSGEGASPGISKMPGVSVDRTLGSRYELKYLISESKARAVEQYVSAYLDKDRYSKLWPTGYYPIVSLYLDSEDMQLCRESINGVLNRFKLRIRSYTDDRSYPRFLEIKRRANTVIVKSRYRTKDRDVRALLTGQYIHPQYYGTDEEVLQQFQLYVRSINARPAVLIRYKRKAYEGDTSQRVRVTFDRELAYNVTEKPEVRLNGSGWEFHKLSLDKVILEIKFTGHFPAWLSDMAKHLEVEQQSMSKYANSIREACLLRYCSPRFSQETFGL